MLQVKNLVKRYATKGETVTALDGVSVDFPERGMVFLLGKSGSGKSTLLNISGGLDVPDEGEIVVKGKSSKDFSKSDFDSYRNTYVGFIFQEYNILTELTVAENVALAIELQGKPKDPKRVEELLEEVDLGGLGERRPNTLSGGQKQRVAIARALVKNPEIIMADEPTGALDSATGAQVFETLKKLSGEKLVVVVSHDRDFAERYADRIIELSDGKVISDVTRGESGAPAGNLTELSEKKLAIRSGAALSNDEAERILAFLKRNKGSVVITSEKEETLSEAERAQGSGFHRTETREIPDVPDESKFIRSKFPIRYALKMGFSGLKLKPVRLAFTTLLAAIAFIVFGFFSTVVTFESGKVAANTLDQSAYSAGVLMKKAVLHYLDGEREFTRKVPTQNTSSWQNVGSVHFTQEEAERLASEYPSLGLIPVFNFDLPYLSFTPSQGTEFYPFYSSLSFFSGFAEASYAQASGIGLLEGRWPEATQGVKEAVISPLVLENYIVHGYRAGTNSALTEIHSFQDLEGKEIALGTASASPVYIKVVGLADVQTDLSEWESLKTGETLLYEEQAVFTDHYRYSLASVCFVADDFYEGNRALDLSRTNYETLLRNVHGGIYGLGTTDYSENVSGKYYQYLYVPLSEARAAKCSELMRRLHDSTDEERDTYYYAPYSFVQEISNGEKTLNRLFGFLLAAAIVLAVFAALLLFNFISASINAKKKDIGILRAVGARGIDVFKIFIVEGFAITLFCFALGCLGSFGVCTLVNSFIISQGVLSFRVFDFNLLNALWVLGIACLTALVATSVPVALTVRKKPVEAIRAI